MPIGLVRSLQVPVGIRKGEPSPSSRRISEGASKQVVQTKRELLCEQQPNTEGFMHMRHPCYNRSRQDALRHHRFQGKHVDDPEKSW